MTLPRIYQIVVEMDRRAREKLEAAFPGDQGKINYMAVSYTHLAEKAGDPAPVAGE